MGYFYDIEYKSTNIFGNADGLSRLPVGPDQCFDRQNYGRINVIELLQVEKLEELPVKGGRGFPKPFKHRLTNRMRLTQ